MLTDHVDVVIGVDTHKHTHAAAALNASGAVLAQLTVPADPKGYRRLVAFAEAHGRTRLWAIEGTGSFGAGLTTTLLARQEHVIEVDRPKRAPRRAGAKSDAIDAVRAAREVLSGDRTGEPRCRGQREAIRVLLITRAQAIDFRTRAIVALHALVVSAPDDLRQRLRTLSLSRLLETCAALRGSARQNTEEFATVMAMRATARRALACQREASELEAHLDALVRQVAPGLLDQVGIGPVVAAQVIVSWSHRGRVRSEAAFAQLAGVAPVPASSGQTIRHRLNHSGDRQLNRALHTVVMVRMRQDPTTKAYVARRLAEGKTTREIKRCLKRYVARQLFRELEAMPLPLDGI
jgi:transposase